MKIAMHFPGQGSQSQGMIAELALSFPLVSELFSRASDVLSYDLWKLVQEGPVDQLNQTEFTQPALLAANIAVWECWKAKGGVNPTTVAGHSLGEYAALVSADAIDFEAAIACVALRGRAMQAAVPAGTGAMAAIIGLDDEKVDALCQRVAESEVVSAANFNSVGQVVISGHKTAVERAIAEAKSEGAKLAKLIPVSVPSHCALMQPAAEALTEKLKTIDIRKPKFPVIHNVDVAEHVSPEAIRNALVQQLVKPVRWVDTVLKMQEMGVALFLECGPGKVLTGLNKRIVKTIDTLQMNTPALMDVVFELVNKENASCH